MIASLLDYVTPTTKDTNGSEIKMASMQTMYALDLVVVRTWSGQQFHEPHHAPTGINAWCYVNWNQDYIQFMFLKIRTVIKYMH